MSIANELYKLECDGHIHRFVAPSRHPLKRRIYLTANAQRQYENDQSAVNLLVGRGFVKGALVRWITGGQIYASDNGRKGKFLKELDPPPPDIWEIRVTEPVVQARLFGSFPEPDTMIITDLYTRGALGNKGSAGWEAAMRKSAKDWEGLKLPHFHANSIHDYVTENCDDFPLKR